MSDRDLIHLQSKIWTAATESDYADATASTGEPILQSMDLSEEEEEASGEVNTFLPPQKDASAYDLWKWHLEKRMLREEYLDQWNKTVGDTETRRPMDAVIAPVAANTATPHGFNRYVEQKSSYCRCFYCSTFDHRRRSAAYTAIWNALDYPACAFPVTRVDLKADVKKPAHRFLSDADKEHYDLCEIHSIKHCCALMVVLTRLSTDEPEKYAGAPVGLQVVGRHQEEEAVIAITEIVADALKKQSHARL